MAQHRITIKRRNGDVLCARCLLADSPWTRLRGLLGRRGLGHDEGLLIRPAGAVHTLFMLFAIDVVFLGRENTVLKIVEGLRPWRFAGARKAKRTLELPPGTARRAGLSVGEALVLLPGVSREAA